MDQVETLSERVWCRWGQKKKHAYLKILTNKHREQKNSLLTFVWMPCCVFGGKGISLELQKLLLLVSCELFLLLQVPTSFKLFLTVTSFCHWTADGASHPSPTGTFGGEGVDENGLFWQSQVKRVRGSSDAPGKVGPHQDRDSLFNFYWLCNISIRSANDINKLGGGVWSHESLGRVGRVDYEM